MRGKMAATLKMIQPFGVKMRATISDKQTKLLLIQRRLVVILLNASTIVQKCEVNILTIMRPFSLVWFNKMRTAIFKTEKDARETLLEKNKSLVVIAILINR